MGREREGKGGTIPLCQNGKEGGAGARNKGSEEDWVPR